MVIAAAVIRFATSYIRGETFPLRFTLLVLSFVGSILILILSPNLMRILLGWDGLGVTSYLLVIYYQRAKSYNAGLITALSNRVGDVAILVTLGLVLSSARWNFRLQALESTPWALSLRIAVIVLAAITKSAQIPFSAWLPAAIAAPTPVSALVHSSTLVTAGVYLLIRFNLILAESGYAQIILFRGSITILMAGASAIFEIDIKKIVALSTLRQLGLIIRRLGLGRPDLAFFHLLTHAYFKALLFICAGNLIHCRNDYQDLRQMGSLFEAMPVTRRFMNLRNLSLCGIPFLAGFYSKDLFLESRLLGSYNRVRLGIFFFATLLTAAYSLRFTLLTRTNPAKRRALLWRSDEDRIITRGIWILGPLALAGGSLVSWLLISTPSMIYLPLSIKLLALIVTLSGAILAFLSQGTLPRGGLGWATRLIWNLPQISGRVANWPLTASQETRALADLGWFHTAYHELPRAMAIAGSGTVSEKRFSSYASLARLSIIWGLLLILTYYLYQCTIGLDLTRALKNQNFMC